jgi:hypothetical protein
MFLKLHARPLGILLVPFPLLFLFLARPASASASDRCEMIEAAIGGKHPLPDTESCDLNAPCTDGFVHVEPWFFVDGKGRTGLFLRPGTVCKNKYLVVSRRRQLHKPKPGDMASAVVIEFEKLSNAHFQFHAYIEAIDGEGGSGSPGCGSNVSGTIIKRGETWGKRVYELPPSAASGMTNAPKDPSEKPSSTPESVSEKHFEPRGTGRRQS